MENRSSSVCNQESDSASGNDIAENTSLHTTTDLSFTRRHRSSNPLHSGDAIVPSETNLNNHGEYPNTMIERSANEYKGYRPSHLWLPRGVSQFDFFTSKLPSSCLMRYFEVYTSLFDGAIGTLVNARGEPQGRSARNVSIERVAGSILSLILLPLMPFVMAIWLVFNYKNYWEWIGDSTTVSTLYVEPGEIGSVLKTTINSLGKAVGVKFIDRPDGETPKISIDATYNDERFDADEVFSAFAAIIRSTVFKLNNVNTIRYSEQEVVITPSSHYFKSTRIQKELATQLPKILGHGRWRVLFSDWCKPNCKAYYSSCGYYGSGSRTTGEHLA